MRSLLLFPVLVLASTTAARAAPPPLFSHETHVTNNNRGCENCHVSTGPLSPQVDRKACTECHETTPPYVPAARAKVGIGFSHTAHVDLLPCLECHKVEPVAAQLRPVMERARCASCHSERGLKRVEQRFCEHCHQVDERKVKPSDHTGSWRKRHGAESRDRIFESHGKDCSTCHEASACTACHREERPESHTGLWRVRLHGAAAEWDRDSCKACHETFVCSRCHQNTRPVSHTGSWKQVHGLAASTTDNASCRVCHSSAFCAACHRPGM